MPLVELNGTDGGGFFRTHTHTHTHTDIHACNKNKPAEEGDAIGGLASTALGDTAGAGPEGEIGAEALAHKPISNTFEATLDIDDK